ncbi:MAG: hypothetical protein IV100_26385 [Myxococcales bacterium]|nr:hypothetical protein [Myxococcales bacterium]
MFRKTSLLFLVAAATVTTLSAPRTASAQLQATVSAGFAKLEDKFDADGERGDLDPTVTHIPIGLSVNYTFWQGLYGGAGLVMRNKSVDSDPKKSSFGLADLELRLGWKSKFGIVGVGAEVAGKIDLGKVPADLESDQTTTSDNMHGLRIGAQVLASVMPTLEVGARFSATIHFARDLAPTKGAAEVETQSGVLLDPALVLQGSIALGSVALLYGVDIGFLFETADKVAGNETKDSEMNMLYVTPSIGVKIGGHVVKGVFGYLDGDMMAGIPLIGDNRSVPIVPFTLMYTFTM